MYTNLFKQMLIFIIMVTYLVCFKVSLASYCSFDNCQNWFYDLTNVEYCNALYNPLNNSYGQYVSQITPNIEYYRINQACPDSIDGDILVNFYNKLYIDRLYVYVNALYFVIQTITTVGYGDVSAYSTAERVYNIICMLCGVMLFNIASAAFLEFTIFNNDNIYRNRTNEEMIEKMQIKYFMKGKAKKFIKLLGDSAYSEKLVDEIEFTRRLPKYMSETVLNHMLQMYNNKLNLLQNESLDTFTAFMDASSFRRCIPDELILIENGNISIVYSGQIGVKITNLEHYVDGGYIYKSKIGDEFGYLNYLDYKNYQFTSEHLCLCNSELIEINKDLYMDIMMKSNKGLEYIYSNLFDKIFNLYIILSLYYGMFMKGIYIDSTWYNITLSLLNIKTEDYDVMEGLFENYMDYKRKFFQEYGSDDWYYYVIDQYSRKHFSDKTMEVIDTKLKTKYKKIASFKYEYNQKLLNLNLNLKNSRSDSLISKLTEINIFGD